MAHDGPDHHHHAHHHEPHDHVPEDHRRAAPTSVGTWVVSCSDSRTPSTDTGGLLARKLLEDAGHQVLGYDLVKDEVAQIVGALEHARSHGARAVIVTGGTGIARRDVTIEALTPTFDKHLEGFGELFRMLSFQQVGSAAMASRASAGVSKGALVFALPGAPSAVMLAIEKLILPELGHLVRELVK